ncbi:D-alanyl-D-alanine carboxypeptidase family protein [Leucobacter luti]|uniref:D-alanyl-D-alanine carboxypeptidase n=1 Tax=Leucobacter luti TaxID=340320 RepID=A0A4Q7U039_9MICO|nr:D-alanyl-D-alanine carboxypeptidase [Leucobacter luti]MBL3699207.1 D-alanyl-D-alanine carboxypeptidase [Leucobacter luti]RZT66705.1 D-alanyl-D-alanine carboxypeptidase [Leucobacter luti]
MSDTVPAAAPGTPEPSGPSRETGGDEPPAGRKRRRGGWIAGGIGAALVLAAGGYTAACALTPLPEPSVAAADQAAWDESVAAAADEAAAAAQAAVDAQAGPAAIGWQDSDDVWANDDTPRPIASISKLATVLIGLERAPLEAGADGPVHVWSEADAARQGAYIAQDGVAFPIPVGTEVTTRQMLTLALLPSANDFAAAFAAATIGTDAEFSAAVAEWAGRNGLESLSLAEPTGMDEANVASAADVVRLGKLALANPAIAELVSTPSAELPWGIGVVENTNPLLTQLPGVVGLKTGRSSVAGYNLVTAQEADADGRPVVKLTAVLGRDSGAERARDSSALLAAMDAAARQLPLVHPQELVGTVATVDGQRIELVARGSAATVLLPGEGAGREVTLDAVGAGPEGQPAGTIAVSSPTGDSEVPVVTAAAIVEPDLWWRLTHPAAVFGWS